MFSLTTRMRRFVFRSVPNLVHRRLDLLVAHIILGELCTAGSGRSVLQILVIRKLQFLVIVNLVVFGPSVILGQRVDAFQLLLFNDGTLYDGLLKSR